MEEKAKKINLADLSLEQLEKLVKSFRDGRIQDMSQEEFEKIEREIARRKDQVIDVVAGNDTKAEQAEALAAEANRKAQEALEEKKRLEQEAKIKEDEMKRLEFENKLLKIANQDYEPKKEDYDFTDKQWERVYAAWLQNHPDYYAQEDQQLTREFANDSPQEEEEEYEEGAGILGKILLALLGIVLLAGLIFGVLFIRDNMRKKAMAKSLQEMQSQLVMEIDNSAELPTIEAGDQLTYSDSDIPGMKNIPDQLRPYIVSLPEGASISMNEIDTSRAGNQDVTFTITKTDKYNQEAVNYQGMIINIEDTQEPEIKLGASAITIEAGDSSAIKANVSSVIDPVFGEYKYSSGKQNGTYYIDTREVNFEKSGTYPVTVVVYDNGNEVTQKFDVTVVARKNSGNSANNSGSGSGNGSGPVYTYVDQFGTLYTDAQAKEMVANGENVEIYTFEDFLATYGLTDKGDYSSGEAACIATFGKWNGYSCSHD